MEVWKNRQYYLMIIPACLVFFLFAYLPLPGIIIAFKDYNFQDGIFGSPFVGFKNFLYFFKSSEAFVTTFNTLWINFNYIFWGTLLALIVAIMLNEVRQNLLKKLYQNVIFLPYFLSAIIAARFVYMIFATDSGLMNHFLQTLGGEPVQWYMDPKYWVKILTGLNVWKNTGYAAIIYLAVIAGIDEQLYESASLDGATRWQKIRYIMVPFLIPTIIILTLLSIGRMFFGDFQTIYAILGDLNGQLYPTTDIIETYVFRAVKMNAEFSMAAAVGLYQSIMGFILVFGSNYLVKRFNKDYSLF